MSFKHDMYLHYNYAIIVLKTMKMNEKFFAIVDDIVSWSLELSKGMKTRLETWSNISSNYVKTEQNTLKEFWKREGPRYLSDAESWPRMA